MSILLHCPPPRDCTSFSKHTSIYVTTWLTGLENRYSWSAPWSGSVNSSANTHASDKGKKCHKYGNGRFEAVQTGSVYNSESLKSLWTHPLSYVVMEPRTERYNQKKTYNAKEGKLWRSIMSLQTETQAASIGNRSFQQPPQNSTHCIRVLWNKHLNKKTNSNCDFILNHKQHLAPWSPFSLQSLTVLFSHSFPTVVL